jgi:hypothetical protein
MAELKQYADVVTVEMIGDAELVEFIRGLDRVISKKIVLSAMRKGGAYINEMAKMRFMATKKNRSKTGYQGFNSLFKVQPIKSEHKVGVKIGISGAQGYKYRWAQWGTVQREYIKKKTQGEPAKKHYTGKIQATNFFYGAAAQSAEKANAMVSESIILALQEMKKNANNQSAP